MRVIDYLSRCIDSESGASTPTDNEFMARDEIDAYEAALRRLPEAHSLALRLKFAVCRQDYKPSQSDTFALARALH